MRWQHASASKGGPNDQETNPFRDSWSEGPTAAPSSAPHPIFRMFRCALSIQLAPLHGSRHERLDTSVDVHDFGAFSCGLNCAKYAPDTSSGSQIPLSERRKAYPPSIVEMDSRPLCATHSRASSSVSVGAAPPSNPTPCNKSVFGYQRFIRMSRPRAFRSLNRHTVGRDFPAPSSIMTGFVTDEIQASRRSHCCSYGTSTHLSEHQNIWTRKRTTPWAAGHWAFQRRRALNY
jgi:hypothetical protein